MNLAFKPSLREVLSPSVHERAHTELQARRESITPTPWFIRVLIGAGAWLASLFLLVFVALALELSNEMAALVMGLLLTGCAIGLRFMDSGLFFSQAALAIGLAGQGLFAFGLFGKSDGALSALLFAVFEAIVFVLYPDLIQRFLSVCAASFSLLYALRDAIALEAASLGLVVLAGLAHALVLRQAEFQARRWAPWVTPAIFGLITTVMGLLLAGVGEEELFGRGEQTVLRIVVTTGLAAVTMYSAWRVLEESHRAPGGAPGVTLFGALALLSLLTYRTPGVIAAVGVLLLGFHRRSVVLLGMAVVFILAFGVNYYYSLQLTLLAKSLALLGGGLAMLGLRLFILRRFPMAAPEMS